MKKKENELLKAIGKNNLYRLPIYYKIMKERPPQRSIQTSFSTNHNGTLFIPEKFYKPISRLIYSINLNDNF